MSIKILAIGLISVLISVLLFGVGVFYYKNLRGVGPVILPPPGDIAEELSSPSPAENRTSLPLKLPEGFSISVFAKNLPGARVMEFDTFGNLWVSQTSQGKISLIEIKNGKVDHQEEVLKNLRKPHGLAFSPDNKTLLYFAEEDKVSNISVYSEGKPVKLVDLPYGSDHFTRTIGFGPDKKLYVSTGSSCNVCNEKDPRRASIYSMNRDGSDFKLYASGLRNSVFFTWQPKTGQMWATEMGRDYLGDNLPPDEINIIKEGKNYGWPICYGQNIHDSNFDKNQYIRDPCLDKEPSHIDLQAHSAPLGLAFVPEDSGWPKEYLGNLIVAYHGSWNRSVPTGYKLARIKLGGSGNYTGTEDFVAGWLTGAGALGRPVDLKFYKNALYVSDDKTGLIYKIEYHK